MNTYLIEKLYSAWDCGETTYFLRINERWQGRTQSSLRICCKNEEDLQQMATLLGLILTYTGREFTVDDRLPANEKKGAPDAQDPK